MKQWIILGAVSVFDLCLFDLFFFFSEYYVNGCSSVI